MTSEPRDPRRPPPTPDDDPIASAKRVFGIGAPGSRSAPEAIPEPAVAEEAVIPVEDPEPVGETGGNGGEGDGGGGDGDGGDGDDDVLERLREQAQERGEKQDAHRSFWRELPFLVVVALVVAILIKTFLVQAFFIPSASMHETLLEGDRVMVNKLSYRFGSPDRGHVIVFDSPLESDSEGESLLSALVRHVAESLGLSSPDSALIKRVIAVGGETIEIRQNAVLIDGVAIEEPYLAEGTRMGAFGPVTVPDDHVFVMGDNRNQSQDSRRFGTVSESEIIGRAFVIVWPPSRWTGL